MQRTRAIAAIANRDGLDSQALLEAAAEGWHAAGLVVAGLVAENNLTDGECSASFLRDITSGRRFSIQLDAAPEGTTCHLDAAGLDVACADLLPRLAGADVVILSKFGKTEAAGGGLRAAFAGAVASGVPLLTTVSPKHVEAWAAFAQGTTWLEPDLPSILRWRDSATA
ncbi:MAG: DUF2478 domain-containing protein [Rubellimicrobium sp.]|nr:DUF2478 domain-containing protein [Rubellimicrobium sp.]